MLVADTSFLLSLYGNDTNTGAAIAAVQLHAQPIHLHSFNLFEFENAVRHRAFRGHMSVADMNSRISALTDATLRGELMIAPNDANMTVIEARSMSDRHTLAGGHRAFDILHVAAAKLLGASIFLSFDVNQRRLATAEGLQVGP